MRKYKINDKFPNYYMDELGTVHNRKSKEQERIQSDYRIVFENRHSKSLKKIYLLQKQIFGERWAWIPGYEGLYKVSTLGRVKSFSRGRDGKILKPKQTSIYNTNKSYELYSNGKSFQTTACRLVAKTFVDYMISPGDTIVFYRRRPSQLVLQEH